MYDGKHYVTPPKPEEERYTDPSYMNAVDMAVGIILSNELEFEVRGWTSSDRNTRNSDHVEKFLLGVIHNNSDRDEVNIPYETIFNFVRDGSACLYSVWDENIAARSRISVDVPLEEPDFDPKNPTISNSTKKLDGYNEVPIRLQTIDPMTIFVLPGGKSRWSHIMRVQLMSVTEVEELYGVYIPRYATLSLEKKAVTKVELIDYWKYTETPEKKPIEGSDKFQPTGKMLSQVSHALVCAGAEIWPMQIMDNYDDLPFTLGFFKPVSKSDPSGWGHSIIDPMMDTVAYVEKNINRRQRQLTMYSSMPMVAKTQPGRAPFTVDPTLGTVIQLGVDEDFGFARWTGNPPDLEQQLGFLESRMQESSFSGIMYGIGPTRMAGYALSILTDQNRIRLTQPVTHLEGMWSRHMKKVIAFATKFAKGMVVRVYGSRKGQDFADQVLTDELGDYNIACKIEPQFPNDESRKHAEATQARPYLSTETIMEKYLDVDQPSDEQDRKLEEMAMQHPLMQQYALVKTLIARARSGDTAAGYVVQSLAMSGSVGQNSPGRPPEPNNPEQMLGGPSPTGQEVPQAIGQPPYGQSEMDNQNQQATQAPQMMGGIK